MSGLLIGLAVLVALGAMGGRAAHRRLRAQRVARGPGRSPERALRIDSFHELDAFAEAALCACGGALDRLGEGTRSTPTRMLRVVRCECIVCEQEVDLFFDLAELRH